MANAPNSMKNINPYNKILPMLMGIENMVMNETIVPKIPNNDTTNRNITLKSSLFCGYTTWMVLLIFKPLSKDCNSR
jgi:hypothetical protein